MFTRCLLLFAGRRQRVVQEAAQNASNTLGIRRLID
jgi:hypothetical protein